MSKPLLAIESLSVRFEAPSRTVHAVEDVSLSVRPGERVGIIGESGSGKSVTAMSVLRLHDPRTVRYGADSRIMLGETDLLRVDEWALRDIRGGRIAMIFQNPMTSLNPTFTVGAQLSAVVRRHRGITRREADEVAVETLTAVGIPSPAAQLGRHPHQLSGGMRQRVLIAMALACGAQLVIADEPTSALDVTVQAAVLETLDQAAEASGMAVMLITHDMGVIARACDQVVVMYGGRIVEAGPVTRVFSDPRHPYTIGLLGSTPTITASGRERLRAIPGTQSTRLSAETGCSFRDRCHLAIAACADPVADIQVAARHLAACIFADDPVILARPRTAAG